MILPTRSRHRDAAVAAGWSPLPLRQHSRRCRRRCRHARTPEPSVVSAQRPGLQRPRSIAFSCTSAVEMDGLLSCLLPGGRRLVGWSGLGWPPGRSQRRVWAADMILGQCCLAGGHCATVSCGWLTTVALCVSCSCSCAHVQQSGRLCGANARNMRVFERFWGHYVFSEGSASDRRKA